MVTNPEDGWDEGVVCFGHPDVVRQRVHPAEARATVGLSQVDVRQ
jgi:hypothetical protein